ncbi:MAG: hypothetical protein R3F11_27730 [Verrucomicrobiales bacterium]
MSTDESAARKLPGVARSEMRRYQGSTAVGGAGRRRRVRSP